MNAHRERTARPSPEAGETETGVAQLQSRCQLAPPCAAGTFRCAQRCLRRAFLFGVDAYTDKSFEYRKDWIEKRIVAFCSRHPRQSDQERSPAFGRRADPGCCYGWTDDQVAARWVLLFPPRQDSNEAVTHKCARLVAQPDRLHTTRARHADLSWLMRCLAEPITRRANQEDGCKGRFWEERFKSQRLCDEHALLAARMLEEWDTHNSENPDMPLASSLTGFVKLVSHAQRMAQ